MKKQYVTPEMNTVELLLQSCILEESVQEEIPVYIIGGEKP